MYLPKLKIRKELQFTQLSVLLTPHKRSQTKNLKRSRMRKANKNQYAKQPRASKELVSKKLTDHETALLAKGL